MLQRSSAVVVYILECDILLYALPKGHQDGDVATAWLLLNPPSHP